MVAPPDPGKGNGGIGGGDHLTRGAGAPDCPGMTLLVIYVLVALGFSFLCSLLESTLLTVTPSSIQAAKQAGKGWATGFERLKADIEKPLSAILTLNTVAHTMGSTGAGAQYAKVFGDATGGIFAGALTLAVLVFTEIIPKTLGARYAGFFSPFTAWILPWMQHILAPLVWLCRQITRLITFGRAHEAPRHREELLAVAQLGEREGALDNREGTMVRNLLKLDEFRVDDIMTPWTVMVVLPETMTLNEFPQALGDTPFSRIPVHGKTRDQIDGFVIRSEVLLAGMKGQGDETLEAFRRPLEAVPSGVKLDRLFRQMLREHHHMMLVVNEFGTVVGLVTLEDVLETIMGVEIIDESDEIADLQSWARDLWRRRAERMGLKLDEPKASRVESDPE